MRKRPGRSHFDFFDAIVDDDARVLFKVVHDAFEKFLFAFDVFPLREFAPHILGVGDCERHNSRAFGGRFGIDDVVDDHDAMVVALVVFAGLEVLSRVESAGHEDSIVLDAKFFYALVECNVSVEKSYAVLHCVGFFDFSFGDGDTLVQKSRIRCLRIDVCDDVIGFNKTYARIDADDFAVVVGHDFVCLDVEPKLAAELSESFNARNRHAVRVVLANCRAFRCVHIEHPRLMYEAQTLVIHTDVRPVYVEDVDCVFWHTDFSQNRIERSFGKTQEVGKAFEIKHAVHFDHIVFVKLVEDVIGKIIVGVNALFCEIEKDFHRFSRSGDGLFHDVDDVVDADGKSEIEVLAAARRANVSVKFGNEKPVDVKFVVLHHNFAGKSPVAFAANAAIFVQGRVELESTANEARRTTAGEIVLLDKQRLLPAEARARAADNPPVPAPMTTASYFTAIIVPPYVVRPVYLNDSMSINLNKYYY